MIIDDSGFFIATRVAVTCSLSMRATLSPRIIRGDKVLVADYQSVTAVRGLGWKYAESRLALRLEGAGQTPGGS